MNPGETVSPLTAASNVADAVLSAVDEPDALYLSFSVTENLDPSA